MTVYRELYLQVAGEGRISTGYEAGLLGAEGRGVYAGVNAAGLHAEWSRNGGYSYGFEERAFLYAGKVGEISADGKSRNVGLEIRVPSLGKFGHWGISDTYDVSNVGIQKKQREEITKLLLGVNDDLLDALNIEWDSKELGGKLSHKSVVRLNSWLVKNGFERVDHVNKMHGKNSQKLTWRHKGSSEYGNLEIIMPAFPNNVKDHPEWSGAFASYNYGNNIISHFFIDVLW